MKKYIAHAGIHLGSTLATQNSLRSIRCAAAAGFDFCELDIWLTADGIPVAVHNPTLNATYRRRTDYGELPEDYGVAEHTLSELRETCIGRADDPLHREEIPTLRECITLAKSLGIVPMIHPKHHDPASAAVMMDICDEVLGARNYCIVAENTACDYALSRDPEQPCMPVITDKAGADHYTSFPNTIIAIRRKPYYAELVEYTHAKSHPVETTINDDIRDPLPPDIINYDYLSPGRFERYRMVAEHQHTGKKLNAGDTFTLSYTNPVYYGTAEVIFTLCGEAELTVSGRTFALRAPEPTAYRAPVILYNSPVGITLRAVRETEFTDLRLRVGEHPPV